MDFQSFNGADTIASQNHTPAPSKSPYARAQQTLALTRYASSLAVLEGPLSAPPVLL